MNGKKAKALRRAARTVANPDQPPLMMRRRRIQRAEGGFDLRDTVFAPEGAFRQVYQEMKRG